jgi:hypothetical protein
MIHTTSLTLRAWPVSSLSPAYEMKPNATPFAIE